MYQTTIKKLSTVNVSITLSEDNQDDNVQSLKLPSKVDEQTTRKMMFMLMKQKTLT